MTRDEQIAQLKPGDAVEVLSSERDDYFRASVVSPLMANGWIAVARDHGMACLTASVVAIHVSRIRLPEPPPPPKAVPDVRYRYASNAYETGIGHITGGIVAGRRGYVIDFDPAVWTPLDDVKGE
jgi:hypothetical protein